MRGCARAPAPANRRRQGATSKTSCTYPCQGQFKALAATEVPSGLVGAKNTKQNKVLRSLRRQSVGRFSFARVNPCTWLDCPGKL